MEQPPDYVSRFRVAPLGPCSVLRVLTTERAPDAPSAITAIGRIDIMLDDAGCHYAEADGTTFGRRNGGYMGERAVCQPADLVRAVWAPFAPDVLVTHDLSAQLLAFPRAITGCLPWISTLRVARTVWGSDVAHRPTDILAALALGDPGVEVEGKRPFRPAVREALRVAWLVEAMVGSLDVRKWSAHAPSGVHALRFMLEDLAPDGALQSMLEISAGAPVLPSEWPGPWEDDDAWRALPLDDLLAYAGSDEDRSYGLALAEVSRRTSGLGSPEALCSAPVLLRRAPFDMLGKGRCDGW